MSLSYKFVLDYLANHQGEELTYHEIKQSLEKEYSFRRKKRVKFSRHSSSQDFNLNILMSELMSFKLVDKRSKKFLIKKPFLVQTSLAVSRSGSGFGLSNGISDIFISNFKRGGAKARDQIMVKITNKSRNRYEGEVVKIIKSFTNNFIGKVFKKTAKFYLITLIDMPDQPFSALKINPKVKLTEGDYLEVYVEHDMVSTPIPMDFGPRIQKIHTCSLVEKLSSKHSSLALRRIALKYALQLNYSKNGIPTKKTLRQRFQSGLKDKERRDLKKLYTCTIDGDDAKDFDDAISIEKEGSHTRVYVHIADVSYFLEKGSELDTMAFERSNSYYLKPFVLPMLPNILSEEYCSLKPKTKRLTLTCEINFNSNLQVINSTFYRSIVYIDQRFTYSEAEKEIKRKSKPLKIFWDFAQRLRSARLKKGGINLNISDSEMVFDRQDKPITVEQKEQLKSHQLIEEFMLIANIAAARLCRFSKISSIYRVHESMDKAKLSSLNQLLKLLGNRFQLKDINYSALNDAMHSFTTQKFKEIFSYALLRSFMQANYESKPRGHWGLGFLDYAHFTSPIRRYSDLVLHRQILTWQKNRKFSYKESELKEISLHASKKERLALEAERDMFKLLSINLLKNKIGRSFIARFTGFNQAGLFIMLNTPFIEGFIPVGSFNGRSKMICPSEYQVVLTKYSKTVMFGEDLNVQYIKSDWDNMQLVFHLEN